MKIRGRMISVGLGLALSGTANAQEGGRYALDLAGARKVLSVAEAEAKRNGAGPAIAIVDASGQLVLVERLDGAFPAAARVSIGKASTAATFRKPTRDFENIVNKGRFTMTALSDFTPLMGGVPITYEGQVIGAIGVSGAASAEQDDQIAVAGAGALESRMSEAPPKASPAPSPAPALAPVSAAPSPDAKLLVSRDKDGVALQGYDPVAYFTDGKPVPGDPSRTSLLRGAIYQFASAEHKALFDAAPERYAPAFGGYCGYAASIDRLSPISPEYFQILAGRLVLQHNQKALDLWNADLDANLAKADANWPGLVAKNGSGGPWLVNVDDDGVAVLGYDVVAYFSDGRPTKGSAANESTYDGALYRFATPAHRAMFEMDPQKYLPQFGGYCGYAASIDKVSIVDPEIWQIVDGRLVLQHTQKAYDLFNADLRGNLAKADANWPGLVASEGRREGETFFTRLFRRLGLG